MNDFDPKIFLEAPVDVSGFKQKSLSEKILNVGHVALNAPTYVVAGAMTGYGYLLRSLMGKVPSRKKSGA